MTTTYANFILYSFLGMHKTIVQPVSSRNPSEVEVPQGAIALYFQDGPEFGPDEKIDTKQLTNDSPLFYLGGEMLTLEEVQKDPATNTFNLDNELEDEPFTHCVKPLFGGCFPLKDSATVISADQLKFAA